MFIHGKRLVVTGNQARGHPTVGSHQTIQYTDFAIFRIFFTVFVSPFATCRGPGRWWRIPAVARPRQHHGTSIHSPGKMAKAIDWVGLRSSKAIPIKVSSTLLRSKLQNKKPLKRSDPKSQTNSQSSCALGESHINPPNKHTKRVPGHLWGW